MESIKFPQGWRSVDCLVMAFAEICKSMGMFRGLRRMPSVDVGKKGVFIVSGVFAGANAVTVHFSGFEGLIDPDSNHCKVLLEVWVGGRKIQGKTRVEIEMVNYGRYSADKFRRALGLAPEVEAKGVLVQTAAV